MQHAVAPVEERVVGHDAEKQLQVDCLEVRDEVRGSLHPREDEDAVGEVEKGRADEEVSDGHVLDAFLNLFRAGKVRPMKSVTGKEIKDVANGEEEIDAPERGLEKDGRTDRER